jgi:molybdopterin-containing oxidoreductase family membrane subunit
MTNKLDAYIKPMQKAGGAFYAFLAIMVAVIALGAYALSLQLTQGHTVSGLDDIGFGGASWGLYVTMLVYFIGISYAGISVSAAVRLLGKTEYKPVARMGELLSVIGILLGSLAIIFDLGQPLRGLINIFQYGRIGSPLFFTMSVIAGAYLFSTLIYMYITTRRDATILKSRGLGAGWLNSIISSGYRDTETSRQKHESASRYLSMAIIPLLVMAHSFLGFNIGLSVARPGWFGAIQAPAFIAIAAASGIGALIIIAAVFRRFHKMQDIITDNIFKGLGAFMGAATGVYIYMLISEMYVMRYSSTVEEGIIANSLLFGEFSTLYWTEILSFAAAFTIIFAMFVRKSYNVGGIVVSAVLVNIGAVIARQLILVPSQTIGSMLPYAVGAYIPSWVELSVVAGLFALGAFAYALISKVYPLIELPEDVGGES